MNTEPISSGLTGIIGDSPFVLQLLAEANPPLRRVVKGEAPYRIGQMLYVKEAIRYKHQHVNFWYVSDSTPVGQARMFRLFADGKRHLPASRCPQYAARLYLQITEVRQIVHREPSWKTEKPTWEFKYEVIAK